MIKNIGARNKIEQVKAQYKELTYKKLEYQRAIEVLRKKYDITDNNVRNRSEVKVPSQIWEQRQGYVDRILDIEEKIRPLKNQLVEMNRRIDQERNIALMGLFKEIFSDSQRKEIMEEVDRRRNGESPTPLGIDFKELKRYKDGYYKFRNLSKEQLEKMVEFRIMLTGIIEKGCDQFGNAEFLKFISPLNSLIIPVEELRKIKQRFLL